MGDPPPPPPLLFFSFFSYIFLWLFLLIFPPKFQLKGAQNVGSTSVVKSVILNVIALDTTGNPSTSRAEMEPGRTNEH